MTTKTVCKRNSGGIDWTCELFPVRAWYMCRARPTEKTSVDVEHAQRAGSECRRDAATQRADEQEASVAATSTVASKGWHVQELLKKPQSR